MMSKRHSLRALLAVGMWVMSQGLLAESKTPPAKSQTLQLLMQPADKKVPPQLVAEFDLASLKKLPQQSFTTHTPWFKDPMTFTGPLMRDVLASAKLKGKILSAVALDKYKAKLPFSDTEKFDVILAHSVNGEQMSAKYKAPLFIVYPYDSKKELQTVLYYQRSVWQLKALIVE
jgi:hypothetical protein